MRPFLAVVLGKFRWGTEGLGTGMYLPRSLEQRPSALCGVWMRERVVTLTLIHMRQVPRLVLIIYLSRAATDSMGPSMMHDAYFSSCFSD